LDYKNAPKNKRKNINTGLFKKIYKSQIKIEKPLNSNLEKI